MKNWNVGIVIGAAAAIALVFGTGQVLAKTMPSPVAAQSTPQYQMPSQQTQKKQKSELFKGTVAKSPKGDYELNVGGMAYRLQITDQALLARYVGKKVTVLGTLNTNARAIRVQRITLVKSSGQ